MRKLVTVRKITSINPIEGADRIEEVGVDGWSVVCQKGIHSVGDTVLYFELDSFLPESDKRFESFMKFGTRTFDGVVGHRIKTVRLKGVYSQGIIMPLSEFPEVSGYISEDADFSDILGIVKWEAPAERGDGMGYQGDKKGEFPWFLRKSDQERIQNLYGKLVRTHVDKEFVGTLKMDGSSITVGYVMGERYDNKEFFYCSRNQELKIPDFGKEDFNRYTEGKFYQGAANSDLFLKAFMLHELFGGYYAIQGELVGAGVQGNFEKFDTYQVFAYNIFDIEQQQYVDYYTFINMAAEVKLLTVPQVYDAQPVLEQELKDILELSNLGKVLNADYVEGIVWKQVDGDCQFKVISNKYLEKQK
jgi:RNA ligase (TIGR02306 family)